MALSSDGDDCFQLIDSKYRCKHRCRCRKYLKDYYQHFVGYRHVKEEIIFLEQIRQASTHHHEQEYQATGPHGFDKYSKKRCNCKTKKVKPEKIDDDDVDDGEDDDEYHDHDKYYRVDDEDDDDEYDDDDDDNDDDNDDHHDHHHFREISFLESTSSSSSENCTSIFAQELHRKAFTSPLEDKRPTTNSFVLDPLAETLVPNKFESSAPPSISSSSSLSSLTKCTKKVPYSSFHHTNLDWRSRRTLTQSTTTTTATTKFKSSSTSTTSCDILYDYSIINSTTSSLNKLTKVTFGKKLSVETTTKSSLRKPPKFRCNYMLIILIMIVKECHLNFSDTLNRIRRKTQFLLPLLILLQLLMAVPFTHCTSPPNTNQSLAAAMSASNSSAADLLSSSTSPSTAITSTASLSNLSFQNRKIADQEKHGQGQRSSAPSVVSQLSTASRISEISHRPTGGSSITSYFGHEAKIRRDPSLSYTNSGCHSCQMREQVKADNLESIKRHILLRLEMQTIPNITAPQVPRTIIENFYKSHSFNGNKKGSSSSSIHNQQENSHSYSEGASDTKNGLVYKTYPLSQSDTLIDSNSNSKVNGGIKRNDNNMQGDDPNIFPSDFGQSVDHDVDDDDDEGGEKDDELLRNNLEDEVFSVINSVYVFPTMPRVRHNRKAEILNFKFKGSEHSTISQALLHVYIRGRDWMHENEPVQFDQKNINDDHNEIVITIHRVIRRINSTIATHTVNINESKHKIPNGLGQWISIDVTQLVQGWVRNTTTNQGIVIKAAEAWMRPFITTGDLPNNKAFTVYIEMLTKDNRKRRTKRNTSMNCSESDNEERCCRYPLVVNFIEFDWTWVVAPTQFNAYFCNGECKLGFLEKYPHTHLMQLSTAPQPCCSPTKMSPLRLLYFNTENTLVMSTIPNMAVEKCSCS